MNDLVQLPTTMALTGFSFVAIPMMLGGPASPVPDYHGVFLDDLWYYGMIGIGLGMIGLSIYLDGRRGK